MSNASLDEINGGAALDKEFPIHPIYPIYPIYPIFPILSAVPYPQWKYL